MFTENETSILEKAIESARLSGREDVAAKCRFILDKLELGMTISSSEKAQLVRLLEEYATEACHA